MPKVIYGQEETLLPWAQERIGVTFRPDAKTIGVEFDGKIRAVTVFDSFGETDVNMHIASDGSKAWMTKAYLLASFAYPFTQMGMLRVTGLVPANNEAALSFDEKLGFRREGFHPKAGPGGTDLISLGMLREECRFVGRE